MSATHQDDPDAGDIAHAEMEGGKLAVRVDGEWCSEVLWYTEDVPIFIASDGTEVDLLPDGEIIYESPDGRVQDSRKQEMKERAVDEEGKRIYEPYSTYPADTIEVWEVQAIPNGQTAGDKQHGVAVELSDAVDSHWFAEEFAEGEQIALSLGEEMAVAEVVGVEPADGCIAVDISEFDRTDLGGGVALPDQSSTGRQTTNLGVVWDIAAVPVDSDAARDDSVDRVICECGTLCEAGHGHAIHRGQVTDE